MWWVPKVMVSPLLRREKRSPKIELWRSQRGGGHTDGGTVVAVPSKIEKRWRPGKAFVFLMWWVPQVVVSPPLRREK